MRTSQFFLVTAILFLAACGGGQQGETAESGGGVGGSVDETGIAEAQSAAAEEAAALAARMEEEKSAAAEQARLADEAKLAGEAYLHINAQKPGVKVLPSGLQFEIIENGSGRSPGLTSTVLTHYHGTFTNGDVFDSSVERGEPASFPVNRVIAGWTEALQMMREGDIWRLVIPANLAYGERGAGGGRIPPNSVLIFEVELIEVVSD